MAQKIQAHIADCGQCRPPNLPDNENPAGSQSQYLEKYISGEDIIGPYHRHEGCRHKIDEHKVEVNLCLVNVDDQELPAGKYAAHHNDHETHCHQGFQHPGPYLVAPRGGELAHDIGKVTVHRRVHKDCGEHGNESRFVQKRIIFCRPPLKHRAQDSGKETQHDRKVRA